MSMVEKRAKELITEACQEILRLEGELEDIKQTMKRTKEDLKGEGINIKAFNSAVKRYKALISGKKSTEADLDEADVYLEILQENIA